MIQLKITVDEKNQMFEVPTKWDEVSVKQYSEILKINSDAHALQQRIDIMSILIKCDKDIIEMMDKEDFEIIEEHIKFIYTDMETSVVDSIDIDGETYFLYTDFEKLNFGEHYSISILTEKSNGNLLNVYSELLCLFLRKKKPNGSFETFKSKHMDRVSIFENVPIAKVNQLLLFFSNGERGY